MTYGLKEYKELLEKQLKLSKYDSPVWMSQAEQNAWLEGVHSTALYALEMLPQMTIPGFLQKWTSLHFNVEINYLVDCYELVVLKDGDVYAGPFLSDTIENCFILATEELELVK